MQRFYASQAGNAQDLANQSLGQFQGNGGNWADSGGVAGRGQGQSGTHNINAPVSGPLNFNNGSGTIGGIITENGNLPARGGNNLVTLTAQNTSGAALIITGAGTVTANGGTNAINAPWVVANGVNTTSGTLGVGGGSTLNLGGNNTFTGGTTINSGTVVVTGNGQLNWNPNSYADQAASRVNVAGGGGGQAGQPHRANGPAAAGGADLLYDVAIPGGERPSSAWGAGRGGKEPTRQGLSEDNILKDTVLEHATADTPQARTGSIGQRAPIMAEGSAESPRTGGLVLQLSSSDSRANSNEAGALADRSGSMSGGESRPARSAGLVAAEIELPAGGVELDYGCPSGQPELTLTIVREDVVTTGWGLAIALIGLSVLALAAMIARRISRKG
jgi:autotransporter-associated beta strand protein